MRKDYTPSQQSLQTLIGPSYMSGKPDYPAFKQAINGIVIVAAISCPDIATRMKSETFRYIWSMDNPSEELLLG